MHLTQSLLAAAALTALVPTIGASQVSGAHSTGIGHTVFMRGSIVSDTDGQLVACVGKADNAQVGQQLTVYRTVIGSGPRATAFRREQVGSVRINQIVNDHYALVTATTGDVKTNDVVELVRP
jgi:hypothetical protein